MNKPFGYWIVHRRARNCHFFHEQTSTGWPLKWYAVTDEYTRECLVLEVDRSITPSAS